MTAALLAYVAPATADLIGTQVSGSAELDGTTEKVFDPTGLANIPSANNVVISASSTAKEDRLILFP